MSSDPIPAPRTVRDQFRSKMLDPSFPCLGGASAVRRGSYRLRIYPELGSPAAIEDCAEQLRRFTAENPAPTHPVAVHVAVFDGPYGLDEAGFEELLWRQLCGMHELDDADADADAAGPGEPTGSDGEDNEDNEDDPGFCYQGRDFFVVGLHAAASRIARRFQWPTLAFNALSHERPLQDAGKYGDMLRKIRERDLRLQGSLNPTLTLPQLAQFSGRDVGADWRCPLHGGD
ncbi:FPC/CPF motif-containing protein YcgG [Catenulispora sp. GP43]|uniref:guanitoxin biosynthesis heme-dependent pre-guanitoxin N-hydroxylase GntA n=1 Tax=Catenulispora sp. GP43 TaxID=3156263 RepID=UPI00351522D9